MAKHKQYHIEILNHDIIWWVEKNSIDKLPESDEEHIADMIKDGYNQGELVITYGRHNNLETGGWWKIVDWKNIALALRNALVSETGSLIEKDARKNSIKAIKEFDENWD